MIDCVLLRIKLCYEAINILYPEPIELQSGTLCWGNHNINFGMYPDI